MDSMRVSAHGGEDLKLFGSVVIVVRDPAFRREPQGLDIETLDVRGGRKTEARNEELTKFLSKISRSIPEFELEVVERSAQFEITEDAVSVNWLKFARVPGCKSQRVRRSTGRGPKLRCEPRQSATDWISILCCTV
jgi:hypothetical protein